jgi:hypothetical protein
MDIMNTFTDDPITKTELLKWKECPSKNPRTNRKINSNGDLYKFIKSEYDRHFPEKPKEHFKLEDSTDDKDPITLNLFWKIENNIKKIVYEDINKLFLYKDINGFIRCFEKETLSHMKAHKITKHPVTQEDLPLDIFNCIEEINLEEERKKMTNEEIALEIFQKFSSISIFIDSTWFLSLSKDKLKKFNYELTSFFKENFNKTQQNSVSPDFLKKSDSEINSMNINEIQLYLLREIDKLLSVKVEELKYMSNYILVGALGIVIPEIRELYPDFSFSFM